MSAVQIGDVIAVAEVAWKLYNFGWSSQYNASEQYAAFGAEVRGLAKHLDILNDVVRTAEQSLRDRGAPSAARPRWNIASLLDIVGDYKKTLAECRSLIDSNNRYCDTTGAVRNIEWNVMVQPTVDRLRERIMLHNSRIQHALKPFEIDLLLRIHEDLARRIGAVHADVLRLRNNIETLIGVLVPSFADVLETPSGHEVHSVEIPPELQLELEEAFRLHPNCREGGQPPLRDMADSFIASYDKSTKLFTPGLTVGERIPPTLEYICLLKCQFLLNRIRDSPYYHDQPALSHWPGFVNSLEEKLSEECRRFKREMTAPDISNRSEEMLALWPDEQPAQIFDTVSARLMMEDLLEAPLASEVESHRKTVKLLRHMGSRDRRYRLIMTVHVRGQRNPQKRVVDFDITRAVVIPVYALPKSENSPYEITLEENHNVHKLQFAYRQDLFKFQQALTGFKVVDNYAEYAAVACFVVRGRDALIEDASLQLWIPQRLDGRIVTEDSNAAAAAGDSGRLGIQAPSRRPSASSMQSAVPHDWFAGLSGADDVLSSSPPNAVLPLRQGTGYGSSPPRQQNRSPGPGIRAPPSPSTRSTLPTINLPLQQAQSRTQVGSTNAATFGSTASLRPPSTAAAALDSSSSSASGSAVTVPVGKGTGIIHTKPLKPLLVLFTSRAPAPAGAPAGAAGGTGPASHAMVAIEIDEGTSPSPERCQCHDRPNDCRITALEQQERSTYGSGSAPATARLPLAARRLVPGPTGRWDLLPLAVLRRGEAGGAGSWGGAEWRGVSRVSILFRSAEARRIFGGGSCRCALRTQQQEQLCIDSGHVGLLGMVRVLYRRFREQWWHGRYQSHVDVVRRPSEGAGGGMGGD